MSDFDEIPSGAPKKGSKLPLILALLVLLGGGGGAAYFFLFMGGLGTPDSTASAPAQQAVADIELSKVAELQSRIMPMDEIIINIRDRELQRLFKLNISIELKNAADRTAAEGLKPVLLDSFQSYLRSLRVTEIEGSRAIYRIKEDLLSRSYVVLHPIEVRNILFREMVLL